MDAVTSNSTLDNLRPIVVSDGGSRKVLLWLRGTYRAYTDYQQQVLMQILAGGGREAAAVRLRGSLVCRSRCDRRRGGGASPGGTRAAAGRRAPASGVVRRGPGG
jgi:hypothetical protein